MPGTLTYRFWRIFWSIYFVLTIAIVGLVCGYGVTLSIYLLAWLAAPWRWLSACIRHFGEAVQCLSIRFLLRLQPWLKCQTNFHGVVGFYGQFRTRRILFVANHRSNLDTFLLISYIPGLRGLAKSTLFHNLFMAPFMLSAGFVPVQKGNARSFIDGLNLLGQRLLAHDRAVLIFPENTRCEKGFALLNKFGASPFGIAIQQGAVVVPLAIHETDQLLGKGDILLHPFQPVRIEMLAPVEAAEFSDSTALRNFVWQRLSESLT